MGAGVENVFAIVDRQKSLSRIKTRFEDAKNAAQWREPTATENMAFYRGIQWGSAYEFGYVADFDHTGEARETYNYIGPTVRTAVASMLRSFPVPEVVPAHSSVTDIGRAMATQQLVRSFFKDGTIEFEELYRCETDVAIKGACWLKVFFDPNAGKRIKFPKIYDVDGVPHVRRDPATGEMETEYRPEGAIKVTHRDILDVLPDPTATSEEEIGYIFDRKLLPRYRLDDQFPTDIDGNSTEGKWLMGWSDRTVSKHLEHMTYWQQKGSPDNELGELVEYWERPSPANQWQGRLVVYQGAIVLVDGPMPYDWPWVMRNGQYIIPNGLYADGVVTAIKPMQRSINMNASKRREWIDWVLHPHMYVSRQANIERDYVDDVAGQIILYDSVGGVPQVPSLPSPPAAMFEQENALVGIIKDVSTYSDVSRGEQPTNVESGRGLAYLYEFQQGVREPDVRMFHRDMILVLRKCLALARDFYADGRLVKMVGKNNRWTVAVFKRSDYDLELDIEVEMESGAPNSRALRVAEATQWLQLGGFSDTPDAQRFRRHVGMDTGESSTIDFKEANRRKALRMIETVLMDPTTQLMAHEADDHDVFLEELDTFRVTPEYEDLPPYARATVDNYVYQHEMMRYEQYADMAQQSAMGASPAPEMGEGGPGEPDSEASGYESPHDGGTSEAQAMTPPGPAAVAGMSANGRPPVMSGTTGMQ